MDNSNHDGIFQALDGPVNATQIDGQLVSVYDRASAVAT